MELLQLRYFYESAKNGSFSKTAETYFVPATSVSASVKRLEAELGCCLFDRCANRIVLNANGERLKNALHKIFSELDSAVGEITSQQGDIREIRILVRGMRRRIADLIVKFNALYPQISFKTVFDFQETDYQKYDIIIDEPADAYGDWEHFVLFDNPLRVKCAAGDGLCGKTLSFSQLSERKFVSMGEQSNLHRILLRACSHAGFVPDIAVQCNDIECYEKFITSGMGIAIGIEKSDPEISEPGVKYLDITDFNQRYVIFCYFKKSGSYGSIRSFLDFLKSQCI